MTRQILLVGWILVSNTTSIGLGKDIIVLLLIFGYERPYFARFFVNERLRPIDRLPIILRGKVPVTLPLGVKLLVPHRPTHHHCIT